MHVAGLAPARKAPGEASAAPRMVVRIGHGYDIHKLQPGGKLTLGGVVVAEDCSAIAHSDGDVAIHALVDAIFGAMCDGDIGAHFPNSDPQWKDAASRVFLEYAVERVYRAGLRVGNADITVLAEKPKLLTFKKTIAETLSVVLGGAPVSLKAGTNEGCDAVGRGEAIAAHAVVLLVSAG
jgi:2-C-methyl-D-erythritol 2,4-cyclodiphosphate synthase